MRCKHCKTKFEPKYFLQKFCLKTDECIKAYVEFMKTKKKKAWKKEKQERREALKTKSDYWKECQTAFNAFIKLRDKDKPCISCGTTKQNIKYDAGHFHSIGAYPNIRIHEDNCHKQCSNNCNVHLSGNLLAYRENLIKRIGQERFDELERVKNIPLNYTIEDIKEKTKYYRKLVRELKKI